ncbi:MAG: BrnT family toxin [Lysobacterales bacterium]
MPCEFTWSGASGGRTSQHGLDFADAPTVCRPDFYLRGRQVPLIAQRFVTLGLLVGIPVSIVHTETAHEIRIISFRRPARSAALLRLGLANERALHIETEAHDHRSTGADIRYIVRGVVRRGLKPVPRKKAISCPVWVNAGLVQAQGSVIKPGSMRMLRAFRDASL